MELPYIYNLCDKYEKIKPSSICILHSYSCKNRNRRVTVIKKGIKKIKKKKWLANGYHIHSTETQYVYLFIYI